MSTTITVLLIDEDDPRKTSELRLTRDTRAAAMLEMKAVLGAMAQLDTALLPRLLDSHVVVPILDNPSTTQLPSDESKTSPTKGKTT